MHVGSTGGPAVRKSLLLSAERWVIKTGRVCFRTLPFSTTFGYFSRGFPLLGNVTSPHRGSSGQPTFLQPTQWLPVSPGIGPGHRSPSPFVPKIPSQTSSLSGTAGDGHTFRNLRPFRPLAVVIRDKSFVHRSSVHVLSSGQVAPAPVLEHPPSPFCDNPPIVVPPSWPTSFFPSTLKLQLSMPQWALLLVYLRFFFFLVEWLSTWIPGATSLFLLAVNSLPRFVAFFCLCPCLSHFSSRPVRRPTPPIGLISCILEIYPGYTELVLACHVYSQLRDINRCLCVKMYYTRPYANRNANRERSLFVAQVAFCPKSARHDLAERGPLGRPAVRHDPPTNSARQLSRAHQ